MEERQFIEMIQEDPKADASLLIYSDWLEERGDPQSASRAEFLRLTVECSSLRAAARKGGRNASLRRLQELATTLDPSWLGAVGRLPIENCLGKRREAESARVSLITFNYVCDHRWEDLRATDDVAVRSCDGCQQNVHYCETITEAREHAWAGHCIAVDVGVIRRKDDLEPRRMWLGMPSRETLEAEEKRMQPDAVSAERERRKQNVGRATSTHN